MPVEVDKKRGVEDESKRSSQNLSYSCQQFMTCALPLYHQREDMEVMMNMSEVDIGKVDLINNILEEVQKQLDLIKRTEFRSETSCKKLDDLEELRMLNSLEEVEERRGMILAGAYANREYLKILVEMGFVTGLVLEHNNI
ncbi:hypothetical protein PHYBLDRAFT_140244 [Phycomyces blakesleeanus NRRL 1555(-)]|uniref:Uncharacterized protein n=1 Tax=Phycomyces blakesleeanus (strain ATCC 8743b / DSM 1359 / FGSC 10004 / NBRC 33097 / NRRL 1555) TaxID=763407 RepID=A0A167QTA1_PHYB8|nr:hypothetical protein PHYBLDRAFT_140244 [Phycomyces blakesleeanus NRRL 1555(-)]OAD80240.1 hypothetical protein PHYBLDRAFT_140244 [Phycomyces blakesleeanus NRRL 1555(-)]|eukprot:XP_018298280.1 hypothetical protein PHYBLDRAFT_140244 [Phycomyces blakesleeanus NRRL 1555(-)]